MGWIRKEMAITRTVCFLLCFILFNPLTCSAGSITEQVGPRDQNVRVLLSRLKLTDRMDITLTTSYHLNSANGSELFFQAGSELTFLLRDGSIYLYYQKMSQRLGTQIELKRNNENQQKEKAGFYLTNFPALYLGDLHLYSDEDTLLPVLSIHVEDYLLGVVPYEMNNAFPLEALKAQAITARTYALKNQNPDELYDVVDTTNDQVFKGYIPGSERVELAVQETQGVCGFYQNELAQCFYSASNGGQMELVETVWPSAKGDYGYYSFGEDPYDIANPESLVKRLELQKQYSDEKAPYAFRALVADVLLSELETYGMDTSPEGIQVDRINAVYVNCPNAVGSKLMTNLHLCMEISVRFPKGVGIGVVDLNPEEVSLYNPNEYGHNLPESVGFDPVVTEPPSSSSATEFGPYVPYPHIIEIDVPIFPDAERILGMDIIGNYENEIWTVTEMDTTFLIEARRYGHGVGMSQRGAQWMAEEHDMKYEKILAFYYPGMELKRFNEQNQPSYRIDAALLYSPGAAPSPTPRPTHMPVTLPLEEDQWYATVTEISEDSSLNLRSEPSLNGTILLRLYKGQRLLVLEKCPQEGWVHVKTDVVEGYVMESYLTKDMQ